MATGSRSRDAVVMVTSNTADRYWYSYVGFGYQYIMYITASGSLRLGGVTNATGDGSNTALQVQQGSNDGFSYFASFTCGGPTNPGNGIALGGNDPADYTMIKAYNSLTGTKKPLQLMPQELV